MIIPALFFLLYTVVLPALYLVLVVCGWLAPRRELFTVLHIPYMIMGIFLSVTVPPLFFVGYAFFLALLYAPRFACVGLAALNGIPLGIVLGGAVTKFWLHKVNTSDFFPWVVCAFVMVLFGWLGWRYTGIVARKDDAAGNAAPRMRRGLLRSLVAGGIVLLAVGQVWVYRVPIATQAARVGSPALSSALLRVGGIPRVQQEDALFMQAREQGTHADFLRSMLRARVRFWPSDHNVASDRRAHV